MVESRLYRGVVAGGDHVLRGAHERNCACAPSLSLTPTHVTERRALPSLFPLVLVAVVVLLSLHTRRWIYRKTPWSQGLQPPSCERERKRGGRRKRGDCGGGEEQGSTRYMLVHRVTYYVLVYKGYLAAHSCVHPTFSYDISTIDLMYSPIAVAHP